MQEKNRYSRRAEKNRIKGAYLIEVRDAVLFFLHNDLGLSGSDVADILGINKSTVSRIIKTSEKPSGRIISNIKQYFNIK